MGCSFCRAPKPITPEQRTRIDSILEFWYEADYDRKSDPGTRFQKWYGVGLSKEEQADVDRTIKELFEKDYDEYLQGEYTGWPHDRDGRLAAVILLDQFPRSMFRSTAKAFATDEKAQSISKKALKDPELWKQYEFFEKMFFLTALMHSEDKSTCLMPVVEYLKIDRELEASDPETYKSGMGKIVQSNIKFAQDHYTTVQRYGRYPHRN